jgi:plastocyanin
LLAALAVAARVRAQEVRVTGRLMLEAEKRRGAARSPAGGVVWLTPLSESAIPKGAFDTSASPQRLRLVQEHKQFEPHVLVVPLGSLVDFPNRDPLFHNVFSLFNGKRFDLGLYEAGTTRTVLFDRPGVCYIFCNIHPEMSAVVVVLDTPYYAVCSAAGEIAIPRVPPGRYRLQVFHERCLPEFLSTLTREVTISPEADSLGTIRLIEAGDLQLTHKNKYGREYNPPAPRSPLYQQP